MIKIQTLDYNLLIATFKCQRKHFIKDQTYFFYLLSNQIIISHIQKDLNPKYVVPLQLDQTIEWIFNIQHTMKGFGIKHKDNYIYFTAELQALITIRQMLASKIMFKVISSFYTAVRCLGQGSTMKVYLVQDNTSNKQYASKCIDKVNLVEDNTLDGTNGLFLEINTRRTMNHINIIQMHEVYEGEYTYYMILDYMEGQCLHKLINQVSGVGFKFNQIKLIMKQLLEGINYIHSMNLMHRDIKPENIMFHKKRDLDSLKIVDFGLTVQMQGKDHKYSKCGTPGYVAPEVANLKEDGYYDKACDMFSIGVIMYKLQIMVLEISLTLRDLFSGKDFDEVWKLNKACKINLTPLYLQRKSVTQLLSQMLEIDPLQRITAHQALQHQYFDDEDKENDSSYQESFINQTKINFVVPSKRQTISFDSPRKIDRDYHVQDDPQDKASQVPFLITDMRKNRANSSKTNSEMNKFQIQTGSWMKVAAILPLRTSFVMKSPNKSPFTNHLQEDCINML